LKSEASFIYCAGGFGREVMDIARRALSQLGDQPEDVIFIDDSMKDGVDFYGTKSFTFASALTRYEHSALDSHITIANGEPFNRRLIFNRIHENNLRLGGVIDPSVIISTTAILGEGVIIAPFVSVASNAHIGFNVAINTKAIIGHDVFVGDHSVISSLVNLGGATCVGQGTYIGMGAQIKEGVKIGSNVIIGMGSVVYNDIPDGVIALGNPARPMRKNIDQKVFK
jgi:sugar O-acyltransferase (sialic acid O-acetyltransferase NeuD family)